MWFRPAAIATVALGIAGCSGSSGPAPAIIASSGTYAHVIVVIQENRSFDNIFAGAGISGTDVATYGLNSQNVQVPLHVQPYNSWGPDLARASLVKEWNGGAMNGFDQINFTAITGTGFMTVTSPTYAYAYLPAGQIHPYVQLAQTYSLSDKMFSSGLAPSFPGHEFIIAGRGPADGPDESRGNPLNVVYPWGCSEKITDTVELFDGTNIAPVCFTYPTIAGLLDAKNVSWKFYTGQNPEPEGMEGAWDGGTDPFAAIQSIYNTPEAAAKIVPRNNFFDDVAANRLPAVSWVTPNGSASDHALYDVSADGPYWVAEIYEAIAQNPAYYGNTAIVVTWDDSGAWYDHVPPPPVLHAMAAPWTAYQGSTWGMRVPLIFIAANAKRGVSHTYRSFGSIIGFIEQNFGLGNLNAQDVGTDALADLYTPNATATIAPLSRSALLSRAGRTLTLDYFRNRPETPADNQ